MRKLALGLGMVFLCLCCGSASADTFSSDKMNTRIKSLQERLKQFQQRSYADDEKQMVVDEETVDLILNIDDESFLPAPEVPMFDEQAEKRVEAFENRSDVAVTVLFHDDEPLKINKEISVIAPPKLFFEDGDEKENTVQVEISDRHRVLENLRQRVSQAENSRKSQGDIQLLAGLY